MTTPVTVKAVSLKWDAREAFPHGIDLTKGMPPQLHQVLEQIGQAIGTEGKVIVLPGCEPWEAIVVTVDGPGDGGVVAGSVSDGPPGS